MQNQQVLSRSTHPGRLGFEVGLREPARNHRYGAQTLEYFQLPRNCQLANLQNSLQNPQSSCKVELAAVPVMKGFSKAAALTGNSQAMTLYYVILMLCGTSPYSKPCTV